MKTSRFFSLLDYFLHDVMLPVANRRGELLMLEHSIHILHGWLLSLLTSQNVPVNSWSWTN
jgi:hypothetical protein